VNQSYRYEIKEMTCINRSFLIFNLVRFIFLTGYRYDRDGDYLLGLSENEECIQNSVRTAKPLKSLEIRRDLFSVFAVRFLDLILVR
jgi:hypothetical protein